MGKWAETEAAYFGASDTQEEKETMKGRVLPILFNTDMVQAILDGRKTVTRRLVKKRQCMLADRKEPHELDRKYAPFDGMTDAELVTCTYRPPCKPGNILYVRETWRVGAWDMHNQMVAFDYKDGSFGELVHIRDRTLFERLVDQSREEARRSKCEYNGADFVWQKGKSPCRWRPSIHMPKEAARIWLKVIDVRVERLQDMTDQKAEAEGIHWDECPAGYTWKPRTDIHNCYTNPVAAMAALWNRTLHKKQKDIYGWDANPWVWVTEFERCKKPVREE